MRAVNLLPADAYVAKPKLPHAPVVLAATVPVLAGALVYMTYSLEHSKVSDRKIALSVVQSQVASLSPSQVLLSAASQVASERQAREIELTDALGKQIPWDVAFDQIGRVLPANVWLTSLTADSPTPVTGAAPTTTFTIQGYTYKLSDVSTVLARLSLVPSLTNVQLTTAGVSALGKKNVVQFSITASISPGAAS